MFSFELALTFAQVLPSYQLIVSSFML